MGRKAKYTKEQKVQACEDYLSGRKSAEQIKIELNMGKCGAGLVRKWVNSYQSVFMNLRNSIKIKMKRLNISK
jgi:transposase-like protein